MGGAERQKKSQLTNESFARGEYLSASRKLPNARLSNYDDFDKSKKKFVKLSFENMNEYAEIMAKEISEKYGIPDEIIYIERGGMVIARLLSDKLGVNALLSKA